MPINARPFQNEADYADMCRLLIDNLSRTGPPVYATVGDIDWWRASDEEPDSVNTIYLWHDDERLVAFAWPVDDQVDIVVHPDHPALHDAALAWAEAEYRQRLGENAEKPMRAWSFTGDAARIAALTARDYQRGDDGLVFYTRPLIATAEPSRLPAGYTFDHIRGETDVARRAAVHRAVFDPVWMTEAKMRVVQTMPTYRADLDLVIIAPDGSFAAFALMWLDEANHVGVFEPVGVSPEHRRLGLGRAIMNEGARRLGELGARLAFVQTGIENKAAQALYVASGFSELDRNYSWTRPTH